MTARIRKLIYDLSGAFSYSRADGFCRGFGGDRPRWLDTAGLVPQSLIDSPFLYNGGATGARTMLGAVAASTIGVAGTVFSITIASLSLATGQMGPRLLHNFTRDRANQVTLGIFLGTFSYALMVLRSVRAPSEGEFVPHLSLSIGILLAFVCVATLVLFVDHMANRINVDTVIELVSKDVFSSVQRLTTTDEPPPMPPAAFWQDAVPVVDDRRGYLQQLDQSGLADWAAEHKTAIRLLIRPGEYVFPGAPIALVVPPVDGAADAIRRGDGSGTAAGRLGRSGIRCRSAGRGGGPGVVARHQRSPHRDQCSQSARCSIVRCRTVAACRPEFGSAADGCAWSCRALIMTDLSIRCST